MTSKLFANTLKTNNLADFPENTLGVIEAWTCPAYVGKIVVLKDDILHEVHNLISDHSSCWENFSKLCKLEGNYIRVLRAGEKVEITV